MLRDCDRDHARTRYESPLGGQYHWSRRVGSYIPHGCDWSQPLAHGSFTAYQCGMARGAAAFDKPGRSVVGGAIQHLHGGFLSPSRREGRPVQGCHRASSLIQTDQDQAAGQSRQNGGYFESVRGRRWSGSVRAAKTCPRQAGVPRWRRCGRVQPFEPSMPACPGSPRAPGAVPRRGRSSRVRGRLQGPATMGNADRGRVQRAGRGRPVGQDPVGQPARRTR